MGTLAGGEYRTNRFVPQLTFSLPNGWSQFFPDEDDEIYMGSPGAELAISRAPEVVDPATRGRIEAPEDLMAWITEHPAFGSPEPVAIRLGGIDSHYADLPGPVADTKLFHFPGGDFHIAPGMPSRVYVVPLPGIDISFIVLPREGSRDIGAAVEAAQPIVESLVIGE
jgi:hypothetical protein